MAPILVHGSIVPEIEDTTSPMAVNMIGSMMMRGLECPFTWDNIVVFDDEDTNFVIDRLPLAVGPWDEIIQRCHLAFSECKRGNIPKSLQFIADCFIPLLKIPGFMETKCELTKTYRQGLKHVLDATSAFIRLHDDDDESRRLLFSFVASIPSVDSMDIKQKAAISAIRCRLSRYPDCKLYARAAIALDSNEPQWHFYLSKVIYDGEQMSDQSGVSEGQEPPDMADLLKHNKIALCSTRMSPEPFLLMANLILTYGHPMRPQVHRANECVMKALHEFPNSAHVYEQAADIVLRGVPPPNPMMMGCPAGDLDSYRRIEHYYKEALRLAGKEVLTVRHKLGLHQVLRAAQQPGDGKRLETEGLENLRKARHLSTETQIHYALAMKDNLNFSALGVYSMHPPPFMFCDHDEYDEYEDDEEELSSSSHASSKANKKSKKSKRGNRKRR